MKFRFCPKCGAVDMKRLPNGSEECNRCHYVGTAREGAMHEINTYRQQLKHGSTSPLPPSEPSSSQSKVSQAEIQQRLKALKGKSSDDFEIL